MPHAKCCWSSVIIVAVCLLSVGFAQDKSRALRLASASSALSDDEIALRALVDRFFAAYTKKDLDGFMALWSAKSPDYAARKQAMPQLCATENYTFANLTISRVKVDGDKASLRAAVDLTAVKPQTKQERKERMIRSFAFVKEEGAWKVWRYYPAADDLAAALVAAKTEEERKALLTAEKELVTAELRQALEFSALKTQQGWRLCPTEDEPSASLAVHTYPPTPVSHRWQPDDTVDAH